MHSVHRSVHPPGLRQFFLPTSTSTCVDADAHAPGYLGLCTQAGGWVYTQCTLKEEMGVEGIADAGRPTQTVFST